MEHAETAVGDATAHPLQPIINHRELIAKKFPWSVSRAREESPAAVGTEEQEEMLHCAASQGMLSSVQALLEDEHFPCDLSDRFGRTPLHWAAEAGHRNVVSELLSAGASADRRSKCHATPTMLAASRGHDAVVEILLDYRARIIECWALKGRIYEFGHRRSTALHCAAAGGNVRVVRLLLKAGFKREQHDGRGLTPAVISARQSHNTSTDITRLLLPMNDMGGKLVYDHVNRITEDVATVSGLIKAGAFLDWQDGNGSTPLHRTVHFHHVTLFRILLQAGADPNIRDQAGVSPLHIVAFSGSWEMAADLRRAGADLEPRMVGRYCPLHLAVRKNRVNIVSLLLNAGASTELRDAHYGQTPLSWACKGCLAPIVRVLVEAGADIESRSSAGLTPLHWACRFIDAESVEVLLNAGADPGAMDQAAADDAVAKPLSSSGRIATIPVAIDVIGLGYPPDCIEDSSQSFSGGSVPLADKRLDLASVRRIESALQGAKQEHSWRRRGWLVILANRCVAMNLVPGVRDERAAEICRRCCTSRNLHLAEIQLRHADTITKHQLCAHQKGAADSHADANTNCDSPDSQHLQEESSNGQDAVGKRPRSVRSVGMTTRSASRRQRQMCGDNGTHEMVAFSFPKLVDALLGLTAVEVGVFRRVVTFI